MSRRAGPASGSVVASTVASSRNPTLYSTSGEPDSTGSPDHVLVSNTTNWFSTRSSTTTDTAIDVPDGLKGYEILPSFPDALKELKPDELARVAVILISVDPKRDTPARLKEYARFFHPVIVGVTGAPGDIAAVAKRYGVFYAEQKVATAGDGYVVDHSADTYIIAADGKLAGKIAHATAPDQVAAIIRKYLSQP